MRTLEIDGRITRLIEEAVARFELELKGITILTEAASGPFLLTSLIAAWAGGSVIAVTRDSRYGSGQEVSAHLGNCAARLGVAGAIEVHLGAGVERASEADLITNLGFVRPIDEAFVDAMRPGAVVTLMCEPWEARSSDVDVPACRASGVPVLGTNESDPRLQTFRFLGVIAIKLLLELEVEVLLSRLLVISSEPFATPIVEMLRAMGADVQLLDVTRGESPRDPLVLDLCRQVDAVVVAEHRVRSAVIGGEGGIPVELLATAGAALVHITGTVHDPMRRLRRHPPAGAGPGRMTVTTDIIGPRPVADLHAAGLRVGQALVESMRHFGSARRAEAAAMRASPALAPEEAGY
jgi:hypothetical protein